MNSPVRLAILIPAYRPEQALLDVIASLSAGETRAIVVVDDGSGAEYEEIFRRAAAIDKVHLVRHAVNIGKGAALKTGFNYALCTFPELTGVVTADADGQHHPEDIEKVAAALEAQPGRLILGSRSFSRDVPLRSLVGNVVTRSVMAALVGQQVSDTQTGLRGIPASLMRRMLRAEANGYDFELDMLIAVRQQAMQITEVPIRTIYEAGNRTSHFNPLIDSMKIYFVLLRFSSVSLMSAALDTLVFYLAYRKLGNLAASQVLGRVVAVAFNYLMVRRAVFFSRLRHASVLPKYLLLVCTSLTVSYAGIQLLTARLHIGALPAKLLVESLLFFANFAIQRDFIFGKTQGENGDTGGAVEGLPRTLLQALLAATAAALIGVVCHGLRVESLPALGGWTPPGVQRLLVYSLAFWSVSSAILLTAPRLYAAVVVLAASAVMTVAIGPAAVLVVLLFLLAACALGSRLLGDAEGNAPLSATLLGIAVYIFALTWLVRLPVNYAAVYLALMAAPVAADLRGTGRRLRSWGRALADFRPASWSHGAAVVLLGYVLGMHLLIIPKPESSSDGLAMHLAIPVNIAVHHAFTYRPDRILWSVMPMGADWCYALVYLPGGEFAARLLNFALMAILVAVLYRMARRCLPPAGAYLIAAVFASASVVQLITGSMFIENFLAAMVAGAVVAIVRFGETGQRRWLYTAAALAGTGMAIKFGGVVYVGAILPVAIVEIRRQWRRLGPKPVLACGTALVLLLAAAAPAYAIAWKLTRNPLFPFLNRRIPSPVLDRDVNISDYRFTQPLTVHTPYDVTFHSDKYLEGRGGSIGFAYLLLAPLGLLGLIAVKDKGVRSAASVAVTGALIVLAFLPNVRYLYPSLPLLLAPVAGLFGWLEKGAPRRVLGALAIACVALNVWFLPSSNFYHGDFFERSPLSRAMRRDYIRRTAPMREIGEYMNRTHPGAAVFLANGSDLAAFKAEVYSNGWHQYNVYNRLSLARSAHEVLDLFHGWHIRYVAAGRAEAGARVEPEPLRVLVTQCATPEYETAAVYVVRLAERCDIAAPTEREPALVTAGKYDDADGAIAYRGRWSQNPGFAETFQHTVSYSNLPGSDVRIAFEGVSLTVIYTRAPNRAMAGVSIDGVEQAVLDEYAPEVHWQSRTIYAGLKPGRHLATITVLAKRNAAAKDGFVDVDGFEVQGAAQTANSSLPIGEWPVWSGWLALTVILIYLARAWPGIRPETAAYAGAGAALFCWFLYTVRGGLSSWFDADDLMNLYYCWSRPWAALIKANVLFWSSYYRPGGGLFYRTIYTIWGFQPFPFRMAVYILLAADFGLLALVVRKLTGSRWCVLLSLIVLGTHPMFSAAYVDTGTIYDILAYLFYWSAFVLYVWMRERGGVPAGRRLALLICLFVAALNSKEISVTLPVAIGLYELIWHRPGEWTARGLWRWVRNEGRFAAIGAVCDAAYLAGKRYGAETLWREQAYRPRYSLANYFDSLSHYLHDELVYHTFSVHGDLAVLLVAMAVIAAATRRPALVWGLAFILTGILPLAFIPGRGGFAYMVPSVGWAVYLADFFRWLVEKATGNRARLRSVVQAALLVVLFMKLSPWERRWIDMHAEAAHGIQQRFVSYQEQIRALIPKPRAGARILLLKDADGADDWDVFFLIRLTYGDPKMKVERLTFNRQVHGATDPAQFDYVLDWAEGRFLLAGRS